MQADHVPSVKLNVTFIEKINFACHQSAFAVLRELSIENSDQNIDLTNLRITLNASPAALKTKTWTVDKLSAGEIAVIDDRDIELDAGFLFSLSEAMRGEIQVKVFDQDLLLAEKVIAIELLANNEWGGGRYMPELLASFCVPNDPAIDRLLGDATRILKKAGKDGTLDGYNSNQPERVWLMASAIYSAVAKMQLGYALPPTSFERNGQKVRLPSHIQDAGVATCLDSTLLFASAFEQAGLNPLIVLLKGHALVGLWLQPEDLTSIVVDDAEVLRQRLPLKELILIETTLITSQPVIPFSKAIDVGASTISLEKEHEFEAVIDLRRARAHNIMPLSLKSPSTNQAIDTSPSSTIEPVLEEAPSLPSFSRIEVKDNEENSLNGRLNRWQRKLLDLSARNPLLNHKQSKTSLTFLCSSPSELEDVLAAGAKITISPFPDLVSSSQDEDIYKQRTGNELKQVYATDALSKKQVLVELTQQELDKRTVEIYRKAQTSLKEGGSNTLFLAIGFLLWKQDKKEDRRYRAPLILLPVSIERKSVRSGIKITASDDEPRFNTTLLELLKKDFGIEIKGLNSSLPQDHSGVDVAGIWNHIRLAIKDIPGFEVIEDVVLGHFSFAKYLMWKDLVERTDALMKSPVVHHLLETPREPFESKVDFVNADKLDLDYTPAELLTPLPADSSQMSAIATADKGKNFVIIGPPGTGKSQTISNLIAHMLGKGKKVLFVSEKTAALEVVHRRLKSIGLGQFCLELHSNKTKKLDVLNQLRSSWDSYQLANVDNWEKEASRLKSLRDTLNELVNSLHKKHKNGLTAHYAMGIKIRDQDLAEKLNFSWPSADQHDEKQLQELKEMVELLSVQSKVVGSLNSHPLQAVSHYDWSPQWQDELLSTVRKLSAAVMSFESDFERFKQSTGLELDITQINQLTDLGMLAQVLLDSHKQDSSFALAPNATERIEALEEAVIQLKLYSNTQTKLSCNYPPLAWQRFDAEQLSLDWQNACNTWWPKRVFAKNKIVKQLRSSGAQSEPNPDNDILVFKKLTLIGDKIDQLDHVLNPIKAWNTYNSDLTAIELTRTLGDRTREVVNNLAKDSDTLIKLRTKITSLLHEANDLLSPDASIGKGCVELINTIKNVNELFSQFELLSGSKLPDSNAKKSPTSTLEHVLSQCQKIDENHLNLKDWCGWQRRKSQALGLDLHSVVEALENASIDANDLEMIFEAAYCKWWSAMIIGDDPVLRTFSSAEHESSIEHFKQLDTEFSTLTAQYIAAKLASTIPDPDDIKRKSSWGVLRHELQKKTRHKPLRQMMNEIPDVITSLAPCLMMSPLSIAQFMDTNHSIFDVVIFDEASQITVWDAVGALARGKQVIVAGDPKQMPPTNFFARSDNDPDGDIDVEGDLESILDELIGASIPQRVLNLHYRSRKESLIAFSNHRYYDSSLITFPAPIHPDNGVKLVKTDGFYSRGKARHNEGEAKAIVAEIISRLTSPHQAIRQLSIGVVTFNTEQQTLIEDLLDKARSEDPSIEWAFSEDTTVEPVFCKNLETVQGDERDVILFSLTFGPDESGHMTMNFGPLNRNGGERRLNVAMTRARSEMKVFTTLTPENIDLSRTQALAVRDLKHFIEYADRGSTAIASEAHGLQADFDSPFEAALVKALEQRSWTVHQRVGVSAYKIDLGIVNPDEPNTYLAGIEADGSMYHSANTAKERDKIRQSVLTGLGWTIYKVWATDWWINPHKAIDELDKLLQQKLQQQRQVQQQKVEALEAEPIELEEISYADKVIIEDNVTQPEKQNLITEYTPCDLTNFIIKPDEFYQTRYDNTLQQMVFTIINQEGPIHEDLLIKRISRAHGFKRAGRQINERINTIASQSHQHTSETVGTFYWPENSDPNNCIFARTIGRDDETKKLDTICQQEIKLIHQQSNGTGPYNGLIKALRISRVTQQMKTRLDTILTGQ